MGRKLNQNHLDDQNVAKLNDPSIPNEERVRLIKEWHIAQAINADTQQVAAIHISITACGQVKTTGLAIEPSHAEIFLEEIQSVSSKLTNHARPSADNDCQIIPLPRKTA